MPYWIVLAPLLVSLILLPLPAGGWDGNEFLKVPEGLRAAYIAGVADTYISIRRTVEEAQTKNSYAPGGFEKIIVESVECIPGMRYSQITAIVDKYMRDHPEKWHYPMADTVFGVLRAACKAQ